MWAINLLPKTLFQFIYRTCRVNHSTHNKKTLSSYLFIPFFLVTLLFSGHLHAEGYSLTDLGTLGGERSHAFSINNHGQVVGTSAGPANDPNFFTYHPFLWSNGTLQDLNGWQDNSVRGGTPFKINDMGQIAGSTQIDNQDRGYATIWHNGSFTYLNADSASGINNNGQIIVNSFGNTTGDQIDRAFHHKNGTIYTLEARGEGPYSTYANAINDNGHVVGASSAPSASGEGSPNFHATFWNEGVATDLGTLGGDNSFAKDINIHGQIVGDSNILMDDATSHATLWEQNTLRDLGTLGGSFSSANAINDKGQVVGHSFTTEGALHAFLYDPALGLVDLNSFAGISGSEWVLTTATDINEKGQIVGTAMNTFGQTHAFLISPLPEPETYAMMLAGLGLIASRVRRKK